MVIRSELRAIRGISSIGSAVLAFTLVLLLVEIEVVKLIIHVMDIDELVNIFLHVQSLHKRSLIRFFVLYHILDDLEERLHITFQGFFLELLLDIFFLSELVFIESVAHGHILLAISIFTHIRQLRRTQ